MSRGVAAPDISISLAGGSAASSTLPRLPMQQLTQQQQQQNKPWLTSTVPVKTQFLSCCPNIFHANVYLCFLGTALVVILLLILSSVFYTIAVFPTTESTSALSLGVPLPPDILYHPSQPVLSPPPHAFLHLVVRFEQGFLMPTTTTTTATTPESLPVATDAAGFLSNVAKTVKRKDKETRVFHLPNDMAVAMNRIDQILSYTCCCQDEQMAICGGGLEHTQVPGYDMACSLTRSRGSEQVSSSKLIVTLGKEFDRTASCVLVVDPIGI